MLYSAEETHRSLTTAPIGSSEANPSGTAPAVDGCCLRPDDMELVLVGVLSADPVRRSGGYVTEWCETTDSIAHAAPVSDVLVPTRRRSRCIGRFSSSAPEQHCEQQAHYATDTKQPCNGETKLN